MKFPNPKPDRLLSSQGRIGRISFVVWMGISHLIWCLGAGFAFFLLMIASTFTEPQNTILAIIAILIGSTLTIAIVVVNIILMMLRLHDRNHSGWFIWLIFIPVFNLLFILALVFAQGNVEINYYGSPRQTTILEKWLVILLALCLMIIFGWILLK